MKPKILLVNKFYYRRGGDCVCTLNLEKLLLEHGHDVAVFAMQHPQNLSSKWSGYWPEEVSFSGGFKDKTHALKRVLGLGDVKEKFYALLSDFKPDVVHLNNIHSYLSPVLAELAHKYGAKVVWTLHDYKLICPSYSCLDPMGNICEKCFSNKLHVLTSRCMKGSMAASTIAWLEAMAWNRKRLEKNVDMFICPSSFMKLKMRRGGFDDRKLITLCNFVAPDMLESFKQLDFNASRQEYYCYAGRLSSEKGVATLLNTASRLPYKLKIAGDGPLLQELQQKYKECANIEFLGRIDSDGVRSLLSNARFSVLPSECYENNPLGIIESLCAGTPVVGARNGGIPELIEGTPHRGIIFTPGSETELAAAIEQMWNYDTPNGDISRKAIKEFSPETHYKQLMQIYNYN